MRAAATVVPARDAELRRYDSARAFATGDEDGHVELAGLMLWRAEGVWGAALAGAVTRSAVTNALTPLRVPESWMHRTPLRVITDLHRVTSIDANAFEMLTSELRRSVDSVRAHITRHVVIPPGGVLGAATTGVLASLTKHRWELATDLTAALNALGKPSLASRLPSSAAPAPGPQLSERVRHLLADVPEASLDSITTSLGITRRSLQRGLASEGTRYRALRDDARLERARQLLLDPGWKIEAVAHEVGWATLSGFVRWFRKLSGRSPSEFRGSAGLGRRPPRLHE